MRKSGIRNCNDINAENQTGLVQKQLLSKRKQTLFQFNYF